MPDASEPRILKLIKSLRGLFPVMYDASVSYVCGQPHRTHLYPCGEVHMVCDLIAHWNDDHEMTFEEIASKLESLPVDLSVVRNNG